MGKYLRKSKITGDVAVMEVSPATLGVRTRARTLALQHLQSPPPSSDSCYLQLRSRRLEKPPLTNPTKTQLQTEQHPESDSRFLETSVKSGSVSISQKDRFLSVPRKGRVTEDLSGFGAQVSFGDNSLDFEPRDRSSRESTPCSLVEEADGSVNLGSATRRTNLNSTAPRTRNSILRNIPSANEIEEFFSFAEQQQQCLFMDTYNYDVVSDVPVPGRYEWIRVDH